MAVAHRMYARALYEAAQERGQVEVVRDELVELAAAMETTPELEAFLSNPQLDPGAKASVLDEVTTGADPITRNFARLVASKGRAGQIRPIAEEFEAIVDREQDRAPTSQRGAHRRGHPGPLAHLGDPGMGHRPGLPRLRVLHRPA